MPLFTPQEKSSKFIIKQIWDHLCWHLQGTSSDAACAISRIQYHTACTIDFNIHLDIYSVQEI